MLSVGSCPVLPTNKYTETEFIQRSFIIIFLSVTSFFGSFFLFLFFSLFFSQFRATRLLLSSLQFPLLSVEQLPWQSKACLCLPWLRNDIPHAAFERQRSTSCALIDTKTTQILHNTLQAQARGPNPVARAGPPRRR